MEKDVIISVIGGQSLRFKKIREYLDPIVITYRRQPNDEA